MRFHKQYKYFIKHYISTLSWVYKETYFRNSYKYSETAHLVDLINNCAANFDYTFDSGYNDIVCHIMYSDISEISILGDELYIRVPYNALFRYNDFYFWFEPVVNKLLKERLNVLISQNTFTLPDNNESDNEYNIIKSIIDGEFCNIVIDIMKSELPLFQDAERNDYLDIFTYSKTHKKLVECSKIRRDLSFYLEKYHIVYSEECRNFEDIFKCNLDIAFREVLLLLNDYLLKTKGEEIS